MSGGLSVLAPDGVGEVTEGSDLAALFVEALETSTAGPLQDGDVVLVTSKVVSKAEGRSRRGDRDTALAEELAAPGARVVARRGPTTIARTRHGLTMAAAGIDASNVERGTVLLLPLDPDASARALRRRLHELTGARVGVVVTDTAGRAWREGQTDIAIGAAGLLVAEDFAGRVDGHGNELAVTAPAVADELAGAAELAQGKLGGRPFAVVRGRADLVLPLDEHGPGARALVRPEGGDLFGYGAREAVVRALTGHPADRAPFGAPAAAAEVRSAVEAVTGRACREMGPEPGGALVVHVAPGDVRLLEVLAFAHGWLVEADDTGGVAGDADVGARLRPLTP
ncbi:coenzyme F420-0:L-glutamate ligase [uncultured Nocardioides sp.]|uniref:coenzyme F420-0:L-glutamate ligase n=1 Tax=uncultured Nocardioides sp. TaxID=198441 RepID=UPI0026110C97|nr:coenzyme F420-0:L-glutamate ligase [uncultured Nocardioides sp.]